ncbi:MAG: AMP-dependent synthetase/ligase [Kiritimatiellia bacterium]
MTIRIFFEHTCNSTPDAPAQVFHLDGSWVVNTYAKLRELVLQTVGILRSLDLSPAANRVALMLENRPEWQTIYLALATTGTTVVPIDPHLHEEEVAYVLENSEATTVFASARLGNLLESLTARLPNLRNILLVGDPTLPEQRQTPACGFWNYDRLMQKAATAGLELAKDWFKRHIPDTDTIASLIYTSGTTGRPKGAMLSHGNFCSNVDGTLQAVHFDRTDSFYAVLPLFHAYSFTANFMLPFWLGAKVCFMRSLRQIAEDMRQLSPTVLMTVPLMAEKMYHKAMGGVKSNFAARMLLLCGGGKFIGRKILDSLGGKLRFLGVGGAACPIEVSKGFTRLGIPIVEGYGMTEAAPEVCGSDFGVWKPGTVGRVLPNMDYKLVDVNAKGVGELCLRGPNIMKGYFKNEAATREVFDEEGFFHTGDLVKVDANGLVRIAGRKKALIVNREGKNIYPEEVEQLLEKSPYIKDVLVLGYQVQGETGERVGAIVTPDIDAIRNDHPSIDADRVGDFLRQTVHRLCEAIADYKRPRKVAVFLEALKRTSTLKVRRGEYAGALDEHSGRNGKRR